VEKIDGIAQRTGSLPPSWSGGLPAACPRRRDAALPVFVHGPQATRAASGISSSNAIAAKLPELMGGSADLTG